MNFFRLRFINTLLVLFIGVALGYLMKERSGVKKGIPYTAKYPSSYAAVPIPLHRFSIPIAATIIG